MPKPRLLFISNLFPDQRESYRGLDNATLLHHLSDRWDIAVVALRPSLPFVFKRRQPREIDRPFHPRFLRTGYLPKFGHSLNHKLMASSVRPVLRDLGGAFQVALTSWLYPDTCAVSIIAQELGFPFVCVAQGADVHQYLGMPIRRRVMLQHLPAAKAIVARSAEMARVLDEAGLPASKIHTVYNGVDTDLFQPGDRQAARQELGLPADPRIILFVGNFVPVKNPVLLVDAFVRVCAEPDFQNVLLVMVGNGPLEGEINFHVERGGCSSRVLFAGRQPAQNIARFMQAADVLCLPSENEGTPNVLLEAFGSGLPAVATRVGGVPEVLTDEHLGLMAPPRDPDAMAEALCQVLHVLPDRAKIREKALQFTWKRTADAYHALLSQAL